MISLASIYLSPSPLPYLKHRFTKSPSILSTPIPNLKPYGKRIRNGICRAELGIDAPFSIAIGACILSSLVLPVTDSSDDYENDAVLDSTDTRLSVMSIISFIPYFNWLSWVFAWLDSGKRIYAVYAIVYLAPYLRSNLSLSPEESWLPIASIVLCIIHVQIEVSIKNGDIQGFQIFREASKQISSMTKGREHSKSREPSKERRKKEDTNLPSAEEQLRDEIRRWDDSKETLEDDDKWNGERDDKGRRKR